jgi:hypothetical protein
MKQQVPQIWEVAMTSQSFGRWSAEELRAAADIAKEKGVGIRLQADGSISVGIVPPPFATPVDVELSGAKPSEAPMLFTPAMLAERWHCSEQHIRNMVTTGQLAHFHVGEKLLRIVREEVERIENSASNALEVPIEAELIEAPAEAPPHKKERAKRLDNPLARARVKALRDGRG